MIRIDLPTRPTAGRFEEHTGLPAWYPVFLLFWAGMGLLLYYAIGSNGEFTDFEPGIFTTLVKVLGWLYVLSIGLSVEWGWETGAKARACQRTVILGVTCSKQETEAMFPWTRFGIVLVQLGFYSDDEDQQILGPDEVIEFEGWAVFRLVLLVVLIFLAAFFELYLLS